VPELENRLKKMSSRSQRLECLSALVAECMEKAPQKALDYGKRALRLLEILPDDRIKTKVLNSMCWASLLMGKYPEALELGKKAKDLAQKINDESELIMALGSMANIHLNLSDFHSALNYALLAKKLCEQSNDKRGLLSALVSIARVHRNLKEYDKALEYYKQARTISEELGNKNSVARILNNVASVYWELEQYYNARDFYSRALTLMEELGSEMGVALLMYNIACVYSKTGDYDLALKYDLDSYNRFKKIGNKQRIAFSLGSIGRDYGYLKQYSKALHYLKKSLEMALILGAKDVIRVLYSAYTTIYESMGKYKQALFYHKKFKEASEEILNEDRNKRIADLIVLYDLKKKEKENQLLKKNNHIQELKLDHQRLELNRQKLLRNFLALVSLLVVFLAIVTYNRYRIRKKTEQVLRLSERKLKKMNSAKDRLFTIIAHDLANPLNSLLLSSHHLDNHYLVLGEKDRQEFIHNISQQTQNMSDLLENLLQWAMVQIGKIEQNPESVDLRLLTDQTLEQIKYSAQKKKIHLTVQVLENTMAWADKNMMQAVLRNLLSNAIKFTHPGGEIKITSRDTGSHIEITVSDNGVGMNEEKSERLFKEEIHESSRGTANEKGTGLGLVLCKEFIKQNRGEIKVTSQINQGSHFSFTLPKCH
jgi:signal transduction histidine kinase